METQTPMKPTLISILFLAIATGLSLFMMGCGRGSQQVGTEVSVSHPSVQFQVTPAHPVPETFGIAFALVMDCSSSMNEAEMFSKTKETPVKLAVYKFSARPERVWPAKESFATPDAAQAVAAIDAIKGSGGTAIGDAVIAATKDMNASGFTDVHILVVTDGENTNGLSPDTVASEFAKLPPQYRPNVYLVAFDLNATVFSRVKANGWRVLSASDGKELSTTLESVVGGEILLER
jgi:von Willebrand factor type A domain